MHVGAGQVSVFSCPCTELHPRETNDTSHVNSLLCPVRKVRKRAQPSVARSPGLSPHLCPTNVPYALSAQTHSQPRPPREQAQALRPSSSYALAAPTLAAHERADGKASALVRSS